MLTFLFLVGKLRVYNEFLFQDLSKKYFSSLAFHAFVYRVLLLSSIKCFSLPSNQCFSVWVYWLSMLFFIFSCLQFYLRLGKKECGKNASPFLFAIFGFYFLASNLFTCLMSTPPATSFFSDFLFDFRFLSFDNTHCNLFHT